MGFNYFYNRDGERFNFYRIPQAFFEEDKYKILSSDAKILYALLFHRISLSWKNGWIDKQGRVYIIFTVEEIQEKLNCSNKTAVKIMAELDEKSGGIGLIEKQRQGLGKPNIIYVKDFMSYLDSECTNYTSEVKKEHSRNVKTTSLEMKNLHGTNNNISDIDNSKNDFRLPKNSHGTFHNVYLSDEEIKHLTEMMSYKLDNYIERLSTFIKSTGRDYQDHKATILSWFYKDQGSGREKKPVNTSFAEYDKGDHL